MALRTVDGVLRTLQERGITHIFGNPGSTEVPLLDALVDWPETRYLLTLHEGIAMAMADGYAMASRRPAMVSVHATPGVSNLIGGLFLASVHRSPVVVLAGQQDSRLLGRRPFLASDVVSAVSGYVKWAVQAERPEEVAGLVDSALQVADSHPRGPVLVAVPRDFYGHPLSDGHEWEVSEGVPTPDLGPTSDGWIDAAIPHILQADRILVLSGNEVGYAGAKAIEAVTRLAETTGAMVHSEHNAINMHFRSDHPQYVGGNAHGMAMLRPWLKRADTIIAIGCDIFMEDAWSPEPHIPEGVKLIQLNDHPDEVGRLISPTVGVSGDLAQLTDALTRQLAAAMSDQDRQRADRRREEAIQTRHSLDESRREAIGTMDSPIPMPRVYTALRQAMDPEDIMVDEAVNMASYLHHYFSFTKPDTFYSSKQSWLGWGWGAALGVQLARPDSRVVLCIGDGSASYAPQAMWTARRYGIPIRALVLNNGRYMAVANHLNTHGGAAAAKKEFPGTELGDIDFVDIARGFGVEGQRIGAASSLSDGLGWLLEGDAPRLVEVMIDPDDPGYGRASLPRSSQKW